MWSPGSGRGLDGLDPKIRNKPFITVKNRPNNSPIDTLISVERSFESSPGRMKCRCDVTTELCPLVTFIKMDVQEVVELSALNDYVDSGNKERVQGVGFTNR